MKITKRQLKRIIREACGVMVDPVHDHDGRVMGDGGHARMVRSSLFNIASRTQSLHDRLRDEDELPEWVQSKVASILDDVHEIEDHLGYKLHRQETDLHENLRESMDEVESYPGIEKFDQLRKEGDLALKSWLGFMSRQMPSDHEDLAKLWSGMVAAPGDVKAARDLASALGVSPNSASFHARKMRPGTDYPSGAELKEIVTNYLEDVRARRAANPPAPRPAKPYGGGTRNRPYDRST